MYNDVLVYQQNTIEPHAFFATKHKQINNKIMLDGYWNFCFSKDVTLNICEQNFDETSLIKVPSNIEFSGYGKKQYVNTQYPWEAREQLNPPEVPAENYVGLYQRTVVIPPEWKNKKLIISLQGVENAFEIYVNKKFIGYAEDSHTPSEFDLSDFLSSTELDIRIKVYKYSTASWLEDQDFWRFFGIHRSIFIMAREENFINDIKVKQIFLDNCVDVKIETEIDFYNAKTDYFISIFDAENKNVLENGIIKQPILWNADEPYLYTFMLETSEEIIKIKIGIRKVEIKNSAIYINDKRIFLKGINRHDFSRSNGRAVSREEMEWDVKFIKEHNFNAVRTSHYPNDSYFYELCNKYGLYVIDEVNLETHGTWQYADENLYNDYTLPSDNAEYRAAVIQRAKNLLGRDYNHPCVISWSLGNESLGGKTLFEMSEYFRNNDNSRFVHYEGIVLDRTYNKTSDVESRMYPKFEEIINYLESDGEKPFILCEYSHAMGNSDGNIHKYFELAKKYASFQGAFIWEMFEHSLVNNGEIVYGGGFDDRPTDYNFVIDGIVGGDRTTTAKAEYIKYVQQPIEFEYSDNMLIIKNCYDFKAICDYKLIVSEFGNVIYSEKINIQNGQTIEIYIKSNAFNVEIIDTNPNTNKMYNVVARKSFVTKYTCNEKIDANTSAIKVINSSINIGVRGKNFHHMFNKLSGTFSSINFNNKEFIYRQGESLKPNFWRVPTNNDLGASKNYELKKWREVSYNTKMEFLEIVEQEEYIVIKTKVTDIEIYLDYQIDHSGSINVKMYSGDISMHPDLFCFGLRLPMSKEFEEFRYIGNGPEESYSDRRENMLFDSYKINVNSQYKYIVPQEYANRTNVYLIELYGENNHKIQFYADHLFEFSYKTETDQSLESMTHFGYTSTNVNELKIHSKMSGVAGDDSWGAWSWDEYIVKSEEKNILSFVIKGV